MIYNEQQFESFSKPPFKYEIKQVIATHTEIRTAISTYYSNKNAKEKYNLAELPGIDIFLQGSYANDTNISKSSDVDIILRLDNVWRANTTTLRPDELQKYLESRKDSIYTFKEFNLEMIACLEQHFDARHIFNEEKCIKLKNHPKFCDADIVPALTYKLYGTFPNYETQTYNEGVVFDTNSGRQIVNFPKEHQNALRIKSKTTNGNFKESVRMFKTLRDNLIERGKLEKDIIKSYFLENLLFNVTDEKFTGFYKDRFSKILEELIVKFNNGTIMTFGCANGIDKLISEHVCNTEAIRKFLISLIIIRDQNEF